MIVNSSEEENRGSTAIQSVKSKCVKFWTWMITMTLSLGGMSLLAVGIAIIVVSAKYENYLGVSFLTLPVFVIVTASILLCTALVGWFAVKSEKYDAFSAYLGLLVAVLIFEILIAVLAFELNDDIYRGKIINHNMFDSRLRYNTSENPNRFNYYYSDYDYYNYGVAGWDILQSELQCCGYDDVNDWKVEIPLSCCPMTWRGQTFNCTLENAYTSGCSWKLSWMLADYIFVLGITASTVTGLQGIIICIAIWIAYKLKNREEASYKSLLEGTDHSQYNSLPGETM